MSFNDLFEDDELKTQPKPVAKLVSMAAEELSEKLKSAPTIEFMHALPEDPNRITYEDFPFDELNTYAGIDCIATSGILSKIWPTIAEVKPMKDPDEKLRPKLVEAPAILDSVENIEMPAHEFILDLEINGIGYSIERNQLLNKRMSAEIDELDEKIFTAAGQKLDMNSGVALAKFLYADKGFTPPSLTKKGEPAVDGNALLTLAGLDPMGKSRTAKNPELQYLVDMAHRRDLSSVRGTFLTNYVKDFVKRDGRIHPSYNMFGTSGFRISGDTPNLTQLPRPKWGYNVRTCYTVRPGYVFICFDFSSAEVKILASVSKEPAMLKAIQDGLDFHTFSASSMRGIPYDEMKAILDDDTHENYKEYKELRQLSKVLTFSILYGASEGGIAMQLNISKDEALRLMNLYFTTFPKVKDYIEKSHLSAKWNQFVITPLGQRKREFGTYECFRRTAAYNAALRNAQNVLIQSTTSSVGLITFAELNNRLKKYGALSICTVYDSLEIECPIEKAAEVINLCYDTLNNWPVETFDFLELPIGCEGELSFSDWGTARGIHEGSTQEDCLKLMERTKEDVVKTFGRWVD